MLHGATSLIDEEPAFNVVWRHAGVTDYVMTTGRVNPDIDAYFNWPGFFILAALVTRTAGLDSALGLSGWAPVAFELLYLPALVVISRAFTADRRLAWVAVWLFYVTNWVGQDYLSPQAMGYLLYLAMVAVILTALSRRAAPDLAGWRERGTRLLLRLRIRLPGVALEEVEPAARATPAQRAGAGADLRGHDRGDGGQPPADAVDDAGEPAAARRAPPLHGSRPSAHHAACCWWRG